MFENIVESQSTTVRDGERRNILYLYNPLYVNILALRHYVESFATYSNHRVYYMPAGAGLDCNFLLSPYDVVVIHYSLRMCFSESHGTLSASFEKALKQFSKPKFLFIQDEYDNTNHTIRKINELGISTVFTCVPARYIEKIYPSEKLDGVNFVTVLTGYVPDSLVKNADNYALPMEKRGNWLVYRGRELPYVYGNLAREKLDIGIKMQEFCKQNKIPHNIDVKDNKRIYGENWYRFLGHSRATLATESGSNVFDFDGNLKEEINNLLLNYPKASYAFVYEKTLKQHDNFIQMNQISPKIFEAVALRTALVLFEGRYSDVLEPDVHYIVLKKDYSNVTEVLEKLADIRFLEEMTERAYQHVIVKDKYSYRELVRLFDENVSSACKDMIPSKPAAIAFYPSDISDDRYLDNDRLNLELAPSNILHPIDISSGHRITIDFTLVQKISKKIISLCVNAGFGAKLAPIIKKRHPVFYQRLKKAVFEPRLCVHRNRERVTTGICLVCKKENPVINLVSR